MWNHTNIISWDSLQNYFTLEFGVFLSYAVASQTALIQTRIFLDYTFRADSWLFNFWSTYLYKYPSIITVPSRIIEFSISTFLPIVQSLPMHDLLIFPYFSIVELEPIRTVLFLAISYSSIFSVNLVGRRALRSLAPLMIESKLSCSYSLRFKTLRMNSSEVKILALIFRLFYWETSLRRVRLVWFLIMVSIRSGLILVISEVNNFFIIPTTLSHKLPILGPRT